MRSNYKRLGKYIQLVSERNKELHDVPLVGLSISKKFIPSIANIIGTDMSTYRTIYRNQFAYSPVTSRNGDKITIALFQDFDKGLISQAYTPFEVIDTNELLPEYLMMWFSRPEFDRYARFMSHGSARELFSWEDLCDLQLPIPSPNKQKEIVKEYNVIQDRKAHNRQLIQKLEATAQAIYKQWFVDFEFPDEEGKGYKSNGGEMVESELGEMPKGWRVDKLGNHIESASKKHDFKKKELIFFNTSDILNGEFLHNNYTLVDEMPGQAKKSIQQNDILYSEIRPANKRYALVRIPANDYVVSTKLMVLRNYKKELSTLRFYHYLTLDSFIDTIQKSAEGRSGTFPQITFEEDLINKQILIADLRIEKKWEFFLKAYYEQVYSKKDEIIILNSLQNILLSKLATIEN